MCGSFFPWMPGVCPKTLYRCSLQFLTCTRSLSLLRAKYNGRLSLRASLTSQQLWGQWRTTHPLCIQCNFYIFPLHYQDASFSILYLVTEFWTKQYTNINIYFRHHVMHGRASKNKRSCNLALSCVSVTSSQATVKHHGVALLRNWQEDKSACQRVARAAHMFNFLQMHNVPEIILTDGY